MDKKIIVISILFALFFVLTGCGKSEEKKYNHCINSCKEDQQCQYICVLKYK
jgi:uncharacterized lipoprotein YehR (DUF1307 family)